MAIIIKYVPTNTIRNCSEVSFFHCDGGYVSSLESDREYEVLLRK